MKINIGMGFKINNRLYFYIITKHYFVYKYKKKHPLYEFECSAKEKQKHLEKRCLNKLYIWNVYVYVYNVIVISIIWCNIFIQVIDYILGRLLEMRTDSFYNRFVTWPKNKGQSNLIWKDWFLHSNSWIHNICVYKLS